MAPFIYAYVASAVALASIDVLWIGVLMKDFYQKQLAEYLSGSITMWAVVLLYLIFAAGVMYFAVVPALAAHLYAVALLRGALLGFVAYAIYDLTNVATFGNWPVGFAVVDILWGTVLSAIGATVGYAVLEFFSN